MTIPSIQYATDEVQINLDTLQSWLVITESNIGIIIEADFVVMSIQRLLRQIAQIPDTKIGLMWARHSSVRASAVTCHHSGRLSFCFLRQSEIVLLQPKQRKKYGFARMDSGAFPCRLGVTGMT
jgi:hypothetical protein